MLALKIETTANANTNVRTGRPPSPSWPGLTRPSIFFELVIPGCALFGRRPGIQHHALFWIPGSLAKRRAPRNDDLKMDARVKPAHDDWVFW
jgi:hypothetical protein